MSPFQPSGYEADKLAPINRPLFLFLETVDA